MSHTTSCTQSKRRGKIAGRLFALFAFLSVWLPAPLPAAAPVKPASEPIVSSRIRHVAEMIPDSATDLPPYLAHAQDVYLLVTAGGAYTEIVVLANPEVSPVSVAHALSSALAGTSLSGQTVEWSADRYSAARLSVHSSRIGKRQGSNTVPIGPLLAGLRRAGLAPHLLLRVPRYARTTLPPPGYGTKSFRWYDAHHLGGQGSVTVTATLPLLKLCFMLSFFFVVPVIGLVGLGVAAFLTHPRRRMENKAGRKLFRSVGAYSVMSAAVALFAGTFFFFSSPINLALADLWFGSSSLTALLPFLVLPALPLTLLLFAFPRQETRRFGAAPAIGASAIPMSDEEKATRKRVAQWSALPHLAGAVALGIAPFFVSRTNPLYPYIHPVSLLLTLAGAGLAGWILQTRLAKFTQKTPDDDLTWRARQIGQTLGVRMPDVFVEDSSRAAHLAFASHQGHHVTLSRKLRATFTPAETDFVLASHVAGMRRHTGGDRRWLRSLLPLLMLVPVFLLSPRLIPGAPPLTSFIFSLWFPAAISAYVVLCLVLILTLVGGSTKRQIKQDSDTDRAALEATGDSAAALSALGKLEANPAAAVTNTAQSEMAEMLGRPQIARLVLRRAALEKTALTLRFAAAPGTMPERDAPTSSAPASVPEDAPNRLP